MTEEKAIEILKNMNDRYTFQDCRVCVNDNKFNEKKGICESKTCEYLNAIDTVIQALEQKDKEISELKAKYDKDTHTLQNQLDVANADRVEKDKIIDEMAARVYLTKEEREEMEKDIYNNVNHKGFADFVKRYFKMKVRNKYE